MRIFPSRNEQKTFHFSFLHKNENCLLFARSHGIRLLFRLGKRWLLWAILVFAVLSLVHAFIGDYFSETAAKGFELFACAAALFIIHWFFLEVIGFYLGFFMVTDSRIIELHKTVFMREEMNEISFKQITNIHHEKSGLLQNLLNYGTIVIHSNVQQPIKVSFVTASEEKYTVVSRLLGKHLGQQNTQPILDET
jgi:hypothetical protein